MPKLKSAPDRLALLLPWLNGAFEEQFFRGRSSEPVAVKTDYAAIRHAIGDFVASFDGSADAGHVVAQPDETAAAMDEDAIENLEADLAMLLGQGLNPSDAPPDIPPDMKQWVEPLTQLDISMSFEKLRLSIRSARRRKPSKRGSVTAGGVTALRNYGASGAYVLRAQGPLADVVPFLLAHLLTAPGMVAVIQCERPGCTHFVIAATGKRGRPQRFCSAACREWNRELEQRRKQRRRKS